MTQLSCMTDNIALDSAGAVTRGGMSWRTSATSSGFCKGWTTQEIDLKGRTMRDEVFIPMAMSTQWLEPPKAWFGTAGSGDEATYPFIRIYDVFTTKPLSEEFIQDELLHLTDPYVFGIGQLNSINPNMEADDGEFEQLILGRARTYIPDSTISAIQLGILRVADDNMIGSGSPIGSRKIYYTRAYFTTMKPAYSASFMDMPSQRALITGQFIQPEELERLQVIAQNKGVGGW